MAAMIAAFGSEAPLELNFNWDATQYYGTMSDNNELVFHINVKGEQPVERRSSGCLGVVFKHYHLHRVAGYVAPLVIVIADESLEPDDMSVVEVMGMSNAAVLGR
jgi:hypothetical protein